MKKRLMAAATMASAGGAILLAAALSDVSIVLPIRISDGLNSVAGLLTLLFQF